MSVKQRHRKGRIFPDLPEPSNSQTQNFYQSSPAIFRTVTSASKSATGKRQFTHLQYQERVLQTKNLQRGKQDVPTSASRTTIAIYLAHKRDRGPDRHPLRIPYQLYPPISLARRRQPVCTRTGIGYRKGRILAIEKIYAIDEEAQPAHLCRISQTLPNSKRTITVHKI